MTFSPAQPDDDGGGSLAVVVVRYKTPLEAMPSIRTAGLLVDRDIAWYVVDNSPVPATEREIADLPSTVVYNWLGGNKGLSRAYNAALELLDDRWSHVCFLDQDTQGVDTYLDAALPVDPRHDVVLPVVTSGSLVLSPNRRIGPWYRALGQLGTSPRNLSWINSGMIVSRRILGHVRFDERLFLDYVDHKFALDVLAAGASPCVRWDLRLEQDFSRDSDSLDQALGRFEIYRKDLSTFYGRGLGGRLWVAVLTIRRRAVATLRYRTTKFLKVWTHHAKEVERVGDR